MKTIFRYTNIGLLIAAIFAAGAMVSYAQDPCTDAEGQTKAGDEFRAAFPDKTLPGRKKTSSLGKAFLEKYGACESAKELSDYLKAQIPKNDDTIKKMEEAEAKAALLKKFDAALTAKNWDEVYVSGKEVLAKYGDEFRAAEIVLGSIGYDETFKGNTKYNDDTLRYAKQSIADMEAGKTFAKYGVGEFSYATKEEALGWMNLTIGYITQVAKKDKPGALPYLYKATQAASQTAKNPIPFELIGSYYFGELDKVVEQIQAKAKEQKDTDAPDVAQKKVDELKALVAMSNGIAERAMDAFARAFTLAKDATYKAKMKTNVENAYNVRFGKKEPVDNWIASAVAKPFVNPTTPVAPISDPEPVVATTATPGTSLGTGTGTGVGSANGTGVGAGNGTGMGKGTGTGTGAGTGAGTSAKPATTTTVKPATTTTKPATAKPAAAKPSGAVAKRKVN